MTGEFPVNRSPFRFSHVGAGTKVNTVGSKVNKCDGSKVDSSDSAPFPFGPVAPPASEEA
ncbi:MAG: hypothetical protein ACI8V5_004706, partial [Limisphaerales bacterium]